MGEKTGIGENLGAKLEIIPNFIGNCLTRRGKKDFAIRKSGGGHFPPSPYKKKESP